MPQHRKYRSALFLIIIRVVGIVVCCRAAKYYQTAAAAQKEEEEEATSADNQVDGCPGSICIRLNCIILYILYYNKKMDVSQNISTCNQIEAAAAEVGKLVPPLDQKMMDEQQQQQLHFTADTSKHLADQLLSYTPTKISVSFG